jgi:hypothetical protein
MPYFTEIASKAGYAFLTALLVILQAFGPFQTLHMIITSFSSPNTFMTHANTTQYATPSPSTRHSISTNIRTPTQSLPIAIPSPSPTPHLLTPCFRLPLSPQALHRKNTPRRPLARRQHLGGLNRLLEEAASKTRLRHPRHHGSLHLRCLRPAGPIRRARY